MCKVSTCGRRVKNSWQRTNLRRVGLGGGECAREGVVRVCCPLLGRQSCSRHAVGATVARNLESKVEKLRGIGFFDLHSLLVTVTTLPTRTSGRSWRSAVVNHLPPSAGPSLRSRRTMVRWASRCVALAATCTCPRALASRFCRVVVEKQ